MILKALEKAATKSKKDKSSVLNHLMPIILAGNNISGEILVEILLGASGALLNDFLKDSLAKLALVEKQKLLSSAMSEKKLVLVGLLMGNAQVWAGVDSPLIKEFFQHISSIKNLSFVKVLLAKDFSLIDSLDEGAQKSLIEAAIKSKDVDLIRVLLKKPDLFLESLNNARLPILYAAQNNLWQIVEVIYVSTTFLESDHLYQPFLLALKANTPESKKWAIKFASEHPHFICKKYSSDDGNNTALHYAMKNGIEEVVKIILSEENYTRKGARIDEFVGQENLNREPFTAIALAAIEQKWGMVQLHAELYQSKIPSEWNKLYKSNVDDAIKAKSQGALLAAMALLDAFPKEASPESSWIIEKIKDLISNNPKEKSIFKRIENVIFNKKIDDSNIQGVFSRLLQICRPEQRLQIISDLARTRSFSLGAFTNTWTEDPEDIKKNSLDLIEVISFPLVRADVILSALINRPSPVWTKESSDTLYNGTREKLTELLNKDLIRALQTNNPTEIKPILEKMNSLNFKFSKLTLVGVINFEPSPAMKMYILRDFLNIIYGKTPVFLNSDLSRRSEKEKEVIKAAMVSIYKDFIEGNQLLKGPFLKELHRFQNSAITSALLLSSSVPPPEPSAPPLPGGYTGDPNDKPAFNQYTESLPPSTYAPTSFPTTTSERDLIWSQNSLTHFSSSPGQRMQAQPLTASNAPTSKEYRIY